MKKSLCIIKSKTFAQYCISPGSLCITSEQTVLKWDGSVLCWKVSLYVSYFPTITFGIFWPFLATNYRTCLHQIRTFHFSTNILETEN